jgi:hypothetical protein
MMYKVTVRRRRRGARALYFITYESACEYCLLAGLRVKEIWV